MIKIMITITGNGEENFTVYKAPESIFNRNR